MEHKEENISDRVRTSAGIRSAFFSATKRNEREYPHEGLGAIVSKDGEESGSSGGRGRAYIPPKIDTGAPLYYQLFDFESKESEYKACGTNQDFLALKNLLETDLNTLIPVLYSMEQRHRNPGKFAYALQYDNGLINESLVYCEKLAELLKEFHDKERDNKKDKDKLEKMRVAISNYINDRTQANLDALGKILNDPKPTPEKFLGYVLNYFRSLANDLKELIAHPFASISALRTTVTIANLYRILYIASRLLFAALLHSKAIGDLYNFMHGLHGGNCDHATLDDIIKALSDSNEHFFRYVSVFLLLGRLIINLGISLSHILWPNDLEKRRRWQDRFWSEFGDIRKFFWNVNDGGWVILNTLSNLSDFAQRWGLHSLAITLPWMQIVTMYFDSINLLVKIWRIQAKYRAQEDLLTTLKNQGDSSILRLQMEELSMLKHKELSDHWYQFTASMLLATGLLCAVTGVIGAPLFFYFMATVGVAMYFTSEEFGAVTEHKMRLKILQNQTGKTLESLGVENGSEYRAHMLALWKAEFTLGCKFTKYAAMPTLLMTIVATCPPVTAVLAVVCVILVALFIQWKGNRIIEDAWRADASDKLSRDPAGDESRSSIPSGENSSPLALTLAS